MIQNLDYSSLKIPRHSEIVIIGLGLAGLSSAYQLSKAGYQVVGFQQFPDSGYQGTSSCSYTRAFKGVSGAYPELSRRQPIENAEWAQLEKLSGLQILTKLEGSLDIGPKNSKAMQFVKKCKQNKGILTPKQIMSRYPALYVPDDYYGIERDDTRLIDVKNALNALKMGALNYGAKFYYNTKMIKFNERSKTITIRRDFSDIKYSGLGSANVSESSSSSSSTCVINGSIQNNQNQLNDQDISYSKNVVMSMGTYSQQYKADPNVKVLEVEVISITDPKGMAPCLTVYTRDGGYFYQMPMTSTKNPKQMKIGLSGSRCFKKWLKQISYFYPGKQNKVGLSTPCFKLVRPYTKGFDIYNENSVIWCYGFQGHGFKHGPSIGLDVKNIVDKYSRQNKMTFQNHAKFMLRMSPPTPKL